MTEHTDTIVIGGGAMGCASAYYLARRGLRVRLVEASRLGSGSSHGNCGYVCPSHVLPLTMPGAWRQAIGKMFDRDAPIYVKPRWDPALWCWLAQFAKNCRVRPMMRAAAGRDALLKSSMDLYREFLRDEAIETEWSDHGLLYVYKRPSDFEAHAKTADLVRREFGVEMTPYANGQLAELEPTLRTDLAGGWLCPNDSHLRPDRMMAAMGPLLRSHGVEVLEETPACRFEIVRGKAIAIDTSRGRMTADSFVVAAGAESPHLARRLGYRLAIQPGKGYSITMSPATGVPNRPLILEGPHVAVTPWASGLRVGSTMEFVGYDRQPNPRRVAMFQRALDDHFIEPPTGPLKEQWSGWRPMTTDDLPYIGRAPKVKNVVVAAGHGMIGMSTMTATGKLVSEIVSGASPHIDPTPYTLDRG